MIIIAYFEYGHDESYAFRNHISCLSFQEKLTIISLKVCGNERGLKRSQGFHPENKENIWDKREEWIIHQEILMYSEEYPSYPKGKILERKKWKGRGRLHLSNP